MDLDTKTKIIFSLVRNNGQTFSELLQSAPTNRDSLSKGLDAWKKEGLIKQEDRLYYFSTKIKNPLLLSLNDSHTIVKQLDGFMDKIKKMYNPFPLSSSVLSQTVALQLLLKLERYSTPKLTSREKLEFELFSDIFDATIELIFEILRKKDPRKIKKVKTAIIKTTLGSNLKF